MSIPTRLRESLLLLAAACATPVALAGPVDSGNLVETDGWQARLQIDCFVSGQQCGQFRFAATGCQGKLVYIGERDQGYLFKQQLSAGRCEPGCELWLAANLDRYQETCRGSLSGQGRLAAGAPSAAASSVAEPVRPLPAASSPAAAQEQPAAARAAVPAAIPARPEGGIRAGDVLYLGKFTVDEKTGSVNGTGKVEWSNGNQYEGTVRNSAITGKGVFRWSNGDRYEGEIRNGEPHGQGSYVYRNGGRYIGGWKDGLKHGSGRYTYPDGSYWEGEFDNDRKARGELKWTVNNETVSAGTYQARQAAMPPPEPEEVVPEVKPRPVRKAPPAPSPAAVKAESPPPAAEPAKTGTPPVADAPSPAACDASPIFCRAREQQRR